VTSPDLLLDLAWLPVAPADLRARVAAAGDADAIAALAGFALNGNQLDRLGRRIAALRAGGMAPGRLATVRLGVVGNGTLDLIAPQIVASAARHGVLVEAVVAGFGQITQEALDPASTINRAGCDAVLLVLDHRGLPFSHGVAADPAGEVAAALATIAQARAGFAAHSGAILIAATLAPPAEALFGSLDRAVPGSLRARIAAFNAGLAEQAGASGGGIVLLDVAALAETVGLAAWHAPREWHLAKMAFSARAMPLYADHVGRLLGALRGKARRVLVLDLDNTLWGGVIGDDGIAGVKLGQGDPVGESFLALQQYALDLHARGIVLAVSSKNDDAIARACVRDHPDMLLRETHFAVFQANWNDKARNLEAIASTLSLGLDALVFVDDNPAERALVRDRLPMVAVPEMPEDPALYTRTVASAGYFEATAFSAEDRARTAFYADNAQRVALQSAAGSLDDYLASLAMEIRFAPFDAVGRERIAQLIAKSNQFNLTTRRYSVAEVAGLEADPAVFTLQVRLSDRFGDNGMISVLIARAVPPDSGAPDTWAIDTWLMSCRVLGRRVEEMVLGELSAHARAVGVAWLTGSYRPTGRNALVAEHYAKLGFDLIASDPDGTTHWRRASDAPRAPAPMTVV